METLVVPLRTMLVLGKKVTSSHTEATDTVTKRTSWNNPLQGKGIWGIVVHVVETSSEASLGRHACRICCDFRAWWMRTFCCQIYTSQPNSLACALFVWFSCVSLWFPYESVAHSNATDMHMGVL